MGDRVLSAFYCNDYYFSTYNIGTLDEGYNPNLSVKMASSEYLGLWTYIYFGFNGR